MFIVTNGVSLGPALAEALVEVPSSTLVLVNFELLYCFLIWEPAKHVP